MKTTTTPLNPPPELTKRWETYARRLHRLAAAILAREARTTKKTDGGHHADLS